MDDAPSSGSESEDEAAATTETSYSEVKWNLPAGFTLGKEPSKLDNSLVGQWIYLRWKGYGWQLGKIYETVTRATPRLFKKFNYRIQWADNSKGPASLTVDNYAHGEDAALDSWVLLVRKEDAPSSSNS